MKMSLCRKLHYTSLRIISLERKNIKMLCQKLPYQVKDGTPEAFNFKLYFYLRCKVYVWYRFVLLGFFPSDFNFFERERSRMGEGTKGKGEGEAGSPLGKEPDAVLYLRTLGS